jgi:hypothetical protein
VTASSILLSGGSPYTPGRATAPVTYTRISAEAAVALALAGLGAGGVAATTAGRGAEPHPASASTKEIQSSRAAITGQNTRCLSRWSRLRASQRTAPLMASYRAVMLTYEDVNGRPRPRLPAGFGR